MTILTLDRKELEKRIGKITPELEKKITDFGTPVEELTDEYLEVEVFPNRPDLLSLENFARAINQFNGKGRIANFKVLPGEKDFEVVVDKSVKGVRPHTVCAIAKGLKFDDEKIKSIIDIQEKLHNSIGRKRKKVAIGIYPLDKIHLPIKFVGRKNEDVKFLPLEADKEMNARQILKRTAVGKEYAHLLEDVDVYPVFVDDEDEILSMPPIINSQKTGRIDSSTKDVFIECSGHNKVYLEKALSILLASIAEMGGKIYSMKIKDAADKDFVSPDMKHEDMEFKIKDIEKTLGIELKEKDVKSYLARMGIGMRTEKNKLIAEIPCYRADILHWIDLVEEVAIAYGYENFEAEIPAISTIAEENPVDKVKRTIGNILAGLGLLECSSYHLTAKKNVKKMHFDFNNFIEVEASKTERDVLRYDLMTNLLQIISENSNSAYPQKIFEMGRVFEKHEDEVVEEERLAVALIDEKMGFTEIKQVLDYLFKMLDIEYALEDVEDSNYITGRCGKILVNKKEIGRIGEIAPRVLRNWKIRLPTVGLELELEKINIK